MAKKKSPSAPRGFKKLKCKFCDNVSSRVDNNAIAVTCWKCTSKLVNGEYLDTSE